MFGEGVDQGIIAPMRHVVFVLHTDNLRNLLALRQLLRGDIAQSEMVNQSLAFELGKHCQRLFDGFPHLSQRWTDSQVDDVKPLESEISKIIVNGIDQILPGKSNIPGHICSPASADLGDDYQVIRIRMERLLDDPIGHVRAVEVAGIDVIHAGLYRLAQDS